MAPAESQRVQSRFRQPPAKARATTKRTAPVLFLAIEEITKDVYAEVTVATPENAAAFLVNLIAQSPEKIIAVATDILPAFTDWRAGFNEDMASVGPHPFAVACRAHGIVTPSIPPYAKPRKIRSRGVEIR